MVRIRSPDRKKYRKNPKDLQTLMERRSEITARARKSRLFFFWVEFRNVIET